MELVFIENEQPVTDSLTVAEVFNKSHDKVIRDIEIHMNKLEQADELEFSLANFGESTYINERGRNYKKYNLSEEAFTLLVMGYVTTESMRMKVKFIQEFKRMREFIIKNQVKVLDDRTALIQSLRLTAETAEKQDEMRKVLYTHDTQLQELHKKVDEQITIDHGEQRRLQRGIASRVYELEEDTIARRKLFSEVYREIKDRFGVTSYKDVKRKELQSAIRYVENWIPRKVS